MTKKEKSTAESKKPVEKKVSKSETKSLEKVVSSLKSTFNEFDFQSKWVGVISAIFLILISMFVAFDVRDGSVNLDGLEKNVENGIYSNIRNVIIQDINTQYPTLNDVYKQEKVDKEYQKVLQTGVYNYGGQQVIVSELVSQQLDQYKQQFQADNGQTYLTAIDPYHFLGSSILYFKNGYVGTSSENGEIKNDLRVAPFGADGTDNPELHIELEKQLFELNGLTSESNFAEFTSAVFILSAVLATLTVIPVFLIVRKFSNNLFAFLASLILVTIGTFVSRTVAGFVDTDAYQILFPLTIVAFIVYALFAKNKILNLVYSLFAGLSFGLFMWSWASGWFLFLFILISLIGYLIFEVISNLIKKDSNLKQNLINQTITLGTFLVSTFVFVKYFISKNIFTHTFNGLTTGLEGVTQISAFNIWPNVATSVAELNPASIAQIISSVGGQIVFIVAMVALTYLATDYVTKDNKQKLYKRIVLVFAFIWATLAVKGIFTPLAVNYGLLFIIVLFLPVGLGLLLSLINGNSSNKIFMSILLSTWMAGTIYMSLNGVRFILLLAPAFSIAVGIGLYYIYNVCNLFFTKELELKNKVSKVTGGLVVILVIFFTTFSTQYAQAQSISENSLPNFSDDWYASMEKIKTDSSENAIITSWWDFGHFFTNVGQRATTFDGGTQGTPRAHWVGKLLMENDEAKSQDILRMLTCGGNEAHNTFLEKTDGTTADAIKINKVLYKTFGENETSTRDILVNNGYYELSGSDIDEIMELLSCENPRENLLITSSDMIGKAGVWAHWGSWDFTKKYVSDYYTEKSAEQIAGEIDENVSLVQKYIDELNDIDLRAKTQNIKRSDLINRWYADYPSYVPIQGTYFVPCQIVNNTNIDCAQGVSLKSNGFEMEVDSISNPQITINNVVFPTQLGTLKTTQNDPNGQFDLMLVPGNNGQFNSVLAQAPLGASVFSKLYFYNGFGSTHFEMFDQRTGNNPIIVWNTLWEPKSEQEIISAALERLQPQTQVVNATVEENSTTEN